MTVTFQMDTDRVVGCPGHVDDRCDLPSCIDEQLEWGSCDHTDEMKEGCVCTRFNVNVSNANFLMVADRLGIPADPGDGFCGDIAALDLLGRAMVANVGRDDSGTADVDHGNSRAIDDDGRQIGARMIDCGVRPGYFDSIMERLGMLATAAHDRGHKIVWF